MSVVNLSVLVAMASFAHGLDFRGVQRGDSCEKGAERELALKAAPVLPVNHMLKTGLLGFNDVSTPDEPKKIIYGCEQGHIDHYLIVTLIRDEASARDMYTRTKSEFQARFGRPKMDSDTFNTTQRKLLLGLSTQEISRWQVEDEMLNVSMDASAKEGKWNVTISVDGVSHLPKSAQRQHAVDAGQKVAEQSKVSRCEERVFLLNMVVSTSDGATHWGWRVYPGSDAETFRQVGFSPGDLIWQIDGRPISTDDDFFHLLHEAAAGRPVALSLRRGGTLREFKLEPAVAAAALHGCKLHNE
jgi:PDZ domain-containing protein